MTTRYFDRKMTSMWTLAIVVLICALSPGPEGTLDARLYYSPSEAIHYLTTLSAADRLSYIWVEFFDLAFIAFYSSIAYLTLRRFVGAVSRARYLAFVPGFFDVVETVTILLCLFGLVKPAQVSWLGAITLIKWTSGAALCVALGVLKWKKKPA